jgi:hypothetical protein
MPARTRAASASLRARRLSLKAVFAELHSANDALLIAAAGLSAALHANLIDGPGVYELLRAHHLHSKHAIDTAEAAAKLAAASGRGGAA